MTTTRNGIHTEDHEAHLVEWITGAVSGLLVAALIGWIGWQAVTASAEAPYFMVDGVRTTKIGDGWRVEFAVHNKANTTAAGVVVEGTLKTGETAETDQVTLDYVPGQSETTGGLMFSSDPAKAALKIRVAGYTEP
ncbi:TIGR02588 family protein [Rhizobium halophytocola]|uniref:Uncharacterized protein (TIGR02588 family) n=1 Tax=Rhizobium halophytocola TaxID=735519 RepID=A0ABS4E2Z6_9HYPH|nr:TIGR02588 family protein [Rhizobium halophytocola]MBP1852320.1 uncharacterized protein (TIGR02588 family) [Rhizobium halophytocola]